MPRQKGAASPIITAQRYGYDPATGDTWTEYEYEGGIQAIKNLAQTAGVNKKTFDVRAENGMGRATIRFPTSNAVTPATVRYEITLEVLEQEIWTHPTIIAESKDYDTAVEGSQIEDKRTYRQHAEDNAQDIETPPALLTQIGLNWPQVVRMLRDGITGWEKEYIVMRRSRRVPSYFDTPPHRVTLPTTQYIYSTAQLQVPSAIAFNLPDSTTLTPSSADYIWGWRRRPSQSVYEGDFIEQSSEFILAEWSTLLYTGAGANAGW